MIYRVPLKYEQLQEPLSPASWPGILHDVQNAFDIILDARALDRLQDRHATLRGWLDPIDPDDALDADTRARVLVELAGLDARLARVAALGGMLSSHSVLKV